MEKCGLCTNVLINVNRIIVERGLESQYICFSKWLDEYLKNRFGEYYICDQVNQSIDRCNEFFVEAFYRNIPGVYEASERIGEIISELYDKEFGSSVERISITSFRTVNMVHPDRCCR